MKWNSSEYFYEDEYENKAASRKIWISQIEKRKNKFSTPPWVNLEEYVKRAVIQIGLETTCSHCKKKNWHSLTIVDYILLCDRCLKKYDFPQTSLEGHNENWKYRVIGPFAVPNYAEGAYGVLLTINALKDMPNGGKAVSFSTALTLESQGKTCEIDFAIWSANEAVHGSYGDPQLIIGEAKSFANEALKEKDIEHLKLAASWLPNSVLVVSVLKDDFSDKEKGLLRALAEWTRDTDTYQPKHWLILLTGTELFAKYHLEDAWENKGEPHSNYSNHYHFDSFQSLSDATLGIYLGIPSYYSWKDAKRRTQ